MKPFFVVVGRDGSISISSADVRDAGFGPGIALVLMPEVDSRTTAELIAASNSDLSDDEIEKLAVEAVKEHRSDEG